MFDFMMRPRPTYEAVLREYLNSPQIKVLSGVRRCGKSTLLRMLENSLIQEGLPESNTLFLKADSLESPFGADAEWLEKKIVDALSNRDSSQPFYLFLDEIQDIAGWERVVRRIHTERVASIYLTGSNSFLLSSDLATYLSGRYVEIPIWPLSYAEYCSFAETSKKDAQGDLFAEYVRYGGMPGLFEIQERTQHLIARELSAIHDTVILNDVARRFELRDIDLLEKIVRYVFSTSGNLFSTRKVAAVLTSVGRKTTPTTIDSYIDALTKAYLVHPCGQIGIAGKKLLQPLRKFYAPDTGLRNLEIGFAIQDIGFQLENVVFCELRRRGWSVNVGDGEKGEVDFVAIREDERRYIQVSADIHTESTFEREKASLLAIADSFPKLILCRDAMYYGITPEGIEVKDIEAWLLEGQC